MRFRQVITLLAVSLAQSDGTWTVTQAGNKGKAGGSFATEGKAALYACGE